MNMRSTVVFCCGVIALLTPACTVADREWAREGAADEIVANKRLASAMIRALDRYEQDQGQFPEQLRALVPRYLAEITTTVGGEDFSYERDDLYGEGYYLCFDVVSYPGRGCCFHPRLGLWDCSPGCE